MFYQLTHEFYCDNDVIKHDYMYDCGNYKLLYT